MSTAEITVEHAPSRLTSTLPRTTVSARERGLSNNGTANGVSGLKAAGYRHRGRPAAGTIMSTRLSWRAWRGSC